MLYEFGSKSAQTYQALCNKCGSEIKVSTQKDENPEYYTEVHVLCGCGGTAHFKLPVN